MASVYPGVLDSLNDPLSTTPMNTSLTGLAHSIQHKNANDSIEAIQATLGTGPAGSSGTVRQRFEAIDSNLATGGHRHPISSIDGLQISLDGTVSPAHEHTESAVTNLVSDLASKATLNTSTTPSPLGNAAVGSVTTAARADHVHLLPTLATLGAAASAITLAAGSGLTGGGSLAANRTFAVDLFASGGDGGAASTVARGDHIHDARYFTETESNTRFSLAAHTHNAVYAKVVPLAFGNALPYVGSYSDGDIVAYY